MVLSKKWATRLENAIAWVTIIAAAIAVLSAFVFGADVLTRISVIIALVAAIVHPFISHAVKHHDNDEKAELEKRLRDVEPFMWPADTIAKLIAALRQNPSDVQVMEITPGRTGPLSKQLADAFENAGWKSALGGCLTARPGEWITLGGNDPETVRRVAGILQELEVRFDTMEGEFGSSVYVHVGEPA